MFPGNPHHAGQAQTDFTRYNSFNRWNSSPTSSHLLHTCCLFLASRVDFPALPVRNQGVCPRMPLQSRSSRSPKLYRKKNNSPDIPRPQRHQVICADCRAPTTVPFLPVEDRPVYCSDCLYLRRNSVGAAPRPPVSSSPSENPPSPEESVNGVQARVSEVPVAPGSIFTQDDSERGHPDRHCGHGNHGPHPDPGQVHTPPAGREGPYRPGPHGFRQDPGLCRADGRTGRGHQPPAPGPGSGTHPRTGNSGRRRNRGAGTASRIARHPVVRRPFRGQRLQGFEAGGADCSRDSRPYAGPCSPGQSEPEVGAIPGAGRGGRDAGPRFRRRR